MTKSEILEMLKERFIDHFEINKEVNLKSPIQIDYSWDVGGTYITKIRFNGEKFEYYKVCWSGVWEDKQSVFNKYGIRALSDCLGVRVWTRPEYFIYRKFNG